MLHAWNFYNVKTKITAHDFGKKDDLTKQI